jgi:hypothetical protein
MKWAKSRRDEAINQVHHHITAFCDHIIDARSKNATGGMQTPKQRAAFRKKARALLRGMDALIEEVAP